MFSHIIYIKLKMENKPFNYKFNLMININQPNLSFLR